MLKNKLQLKNKYKYSKQQEQKKLIYLLKNKYIIKFSKKLKSKTYKPFFTRELILFKQRKLLTFLRIKVCSNNIFSTISSDSHKIFYSASSGKYKIKISKKNLKYHIKTFFLYFFRNLKFKIKFKNPLIVLTAPVRLRKQILKILFSFLSKNKKLIILVKNKKCFNGCRPKKKKRKKGRKLRHYK